MDGSPISLLGRTINFRVYSTGNPTDPLWTWATTDSPSALSIAGADHNILQLDADNTHSQTAGGFRYAVWDVTDTDNPLELFKGTFGVIREVAPTP